MRWPADTAPLLAPTPGQRSLTLSSAVPVKHGGRVTGAVVVSQSTYRILQALYEVRLRLFEIVLLSMASAADTDLDRLVHDREPDRAAAIVWPRRWRRAAKRLVRCVWPNRTGGRDRRPGPQPRGACRPGSTHTSSCSNPSPPMCRMNFSNPLAAIRTAAETVATADSAEDRDRFREDAAGGRRSPRTPRVAGVRELARIDTEVSSERRTGVEICDVLKNVVEGRQLGARSSRSNLKTDAKPILVTCLARRL